MLSRPEPTCAEVRRELTALALREMPAADAVLVQRHVARCAPCAREGAEVLRLVGGLRSTGGSRQAVWRVRAACAAGLVLVLTLCARPWAASPHAGPGPEPLRPAAVAGLLAAQADDGAWREDPRDGASLFTVGLSGLATVGCLRAAETDAQAAEAARRGCDFLVAALPALEGPRDRASPDLTLRAQAAAAWALGTAAVRWPDRYRAEAIAAIRRLGRLRDGWDPASGDVTAVLVFNAYRAASAIGIRDASRAVAPRHASASAYGNFAAASHPVTRLAEQALAAAPAF